MDHRPGTLRLNAMTSLEWSESGNDFEPVQVRKINELDGGGRFHPSRPPISFEGASGNI